MPTLSLTNWKVYRRLRICVAGRMWSFSLKSRGDDSTMTGQWKRKGPVRCRSHTEKHKREQPVEGGPVRYEGMLASVLFWSGNFSSSMRVRWILSLGSYKAHEFENRLRKIRDPRMIRLYSWSNDIIENCVVKGIEKETRSPSVFWFKLHQLHPAT